MKPGFYVVRKPKPGSNLIVESRCFTDRFQADSWRGFFQSENPKHNVFVIEKLEEENDL